MKMRMENDRAQAVEGVSLHARTGQYLEEGFFDVRELTARERRLMPECIAQHGVGSIYMSVETEHTFGGHYVFVDGGVGNA